MKKSELKAIIKEEIIAIKNKKEKQQIDEILWIPVEWAVDKLGSFISKVNNKTLDADKKTRITVDNSYKKMAEETKDVRYAQFIDDVKKKLIDGKDVIKQDEVITNKIGKDGITLMFISRKGNQVGLGIYVSVDDDSKQKEISKHIVSLINDKIMKGWEGRVFSDEIVYDLNKLYPAKTVDGEEKIKINNPSPELTQK